MENESEGKAERVLAEALGNVSYWRARVGPRSGDVIFKITGLNFSTATPFCVVFQSRQSENIDNGWPDQFAIHVIETSNDFIRVRVRRIDVPGGGWGQQLDLNFIVLE
jgi:hypothetical protein